MANSTQYVGRVGGLAVALGIGAAVVGGAGVAWAETPDSPGSAAESGPPGTAPDSGADPAGPASGPADSHSPRGQWRKRPTRTSLTTSSGTLRLPGTPVTGERREAKSDHRDPKWRKADAGPAAHGNGSAGSGSASPDPVAEAATAAGAPAVRSGAGSPDPGRSRFVRVDAPSRRDGLRSRFNGVADSEGSDTATVTSGSPQPGHGRESVDARESDRGTTESPRLAVLDSKVSPATTPVAAAPPMLRAQAKSAAPTNIVTRLLAPLGIGTRAADIAAKPL